MTVKEVMNIATKAEFEHLSAELLLTDRQREIFCLKYEHGFTNLRIAEELNPPVCESTIKSEMKVINRKLGKYFNNA